MLTEVFRQASTSKIISTAHEINTGKTPSFDSEEVSDCQFIEVENPYEIKEAIKDLMNHHLPQKGHYDPVRDIQILTPMNKGELGTELLNQELQELLNPYKENSQEFKRDTTVFRNGDKVIQSANNYDLNVYNGDIGIVQHAGVQGGKLIISFGERLVTYEKEDSFDLKHAYAITIHKSQGSEFPVVIIPICMQHYLMLQRNLVYTALTRAKRLAIFVGTRNALEQAVRTQTSLKRQTKLMERIQSYESNSI
jgi:exodeoxyribonuclease V alpha subunit